MNKTEGYVEELTQLKENEMSGYQEYWKAVSAVTSNGYEQQVKFALGLGEINQEKKRDQQPQAQA